MGIGWSALRLLKKRTAARMSAQATVVQMTVIATSLIFVLMLLTLPNAQRSHAGPVTAECEQDARPA